MLLSKRKSGTATSAVSEKSDTYQIFRQEAATNQSRLQRFREIPMERQENKMYLLKQKSFNRSLTNLNKMLDATESHLYSIWFGLVLKKKVSVLQSDKVKNIQKFHLVHRLSFCKGANSWAIFLSYGPFSSAQLSPCLLREQPGEQAAGGRTWPYISSHTLSSSFPPSHHARKGDGYVTLWYFQRDTLMKKSFHDKFYFFCSKSRIKISEWHYFSHFLH